MDNIVETSEDNSSPLDKNDKRNRAFFIHLEQTKKIQEKPCLTEHAFTVRDVSNTHIFVVAIDNIPMFYTYDRQDALNKASAYLELRKNSFDRKYYIDTVNENQINLTSIYNYGIILTESVEHTANIYSIPKIQFMIQ
jgi:hypothetical protein